MRRMYDVADELVHRSEALRRRILPAGGISGSDGFRGDLAHLRCLLDEAEEVAKRTDFVAGPPSQEPRPRG